MKNVVCGVDLQMAADVVNYVRMEFDPVGKEDHEPETKTNCKLLERRCLTHIYGRRMCQKNNELVQIPLFLLDKQIGLVR